MFASPLSSRNARWFAIATVALVSNGSFLFAASPGQPVVARLEMKFAEGDDVVDVIAKGDLLTVVEVRGEEYVIVTHDGTRGVVDKVNAVELAESTDIYTELIETFPEEGRFHTLRASAWWALGKTDKAIADFNAAITKGYVAAHAYSSRGLFHAANGDFDEAIADYDRALEADPEDATPLINRGAVHMSQGKFDAAIEDYSEALKIRTDNVELLRQRAIAQKAAGRLGDAVSDFDAILELKPDDASAIMGRGYIRFQRQEYAAAAADFSAALELNREDPVAWNNRGYNRYQLGKAAEALQDYDKAIELAPDYGLAHQNRAWLLATTESDELRNPDQAVASARTACDLSSYNNVGDLSALAAALAAQGEFEEAVGWQEKVVQAAPKEVKTFAEKMLGRYRDRKPYIADPVAAEQAEAKAKLAVASETAKQQNEAAKKEAAAKLQAEEDAKAKAAAPDQEPGE